MSLKRHNLKRRLLWLSLAVFSIFGVFAVPLLVWNRAFTRARDSGSLSRWLNRHPERLSVSWQQMDSPWPGYFVARGLELQGRTERRAWRLRIREAEGWLQPLRLVLRELAFQDLKLQDIQVAVRSFVPKPADPWLERLPRGPLPDLGELDLSPPQVPPRPRPWSFRVERAQIHGPLELAVDGLTASGFLTGSVGFRRIRHEKVHVFPSELHFAGLEISGGEVRLAWQLVGELRLQSTPYPYRGARLGDFLNASALELRLVQGSVDGRILGAALLAPWPWLHLEAGAAALRGSMRWKRGVLERLTSLNFQLQPVTLEVLGFRFSGTAQVGVEVPNSRSTQISLTVPRWEWSRSGEPPFAMGQGLEVSGRTKALRWAQAPEAQEAQLHLGQANLPDLTVLNEFLPASGRFAIVSGSGRVHGQVSFGGALSQSSGSVELEGQKVRFRAGEEVVEGSLRFNLQLSRPSWNPPRIELDGSRMSVSGLAFSGGAARLDPGWWGELFVEEGHLLLSRPAMLSGFFLARAADTSPLVSLFDLRRDLPRWLERLLTIPQPSATVKLSWKPGHLEVHDSRLVLQEGEFRARLRLEEDLRKGRLFARWRHLRGGIELENGQVRWVLRDLDRWFDSPL